MIQQIIQLDRRTAKDVMKPRTRMACIPDDLTVEEMTDAARKFKQRRLPVYDETPDTIVGVLNTRTFLLDPRNDLVEAIEFPSFVPESMNLLTLLKSLQRQQRGLAIVLDEFGTTAGIVTMEDILEELVGDIRGEGEQEGFLMERLGDGRLRVNGAMRIEGFRREYAGIGAVEEVDDLRLDNVWNVDLRLAKNFLLMGRSTINLTADLFNVFNNNVELQRNRVVGGTYNQLNQNLSPRILRFGVRIGF
jgi:CBS domain containing-hemolysin-like protein